MTGHDIAKRILIAGVVIVCSSPALADAIDGDWCSTTEARQLRIAGPNITTPGGRQTTGDYSRHAFSYIVPEGESGAGEAVAMQLLNEEEVQISGISNAPEVWRRCELIS